MVQWEKSYKNMQYTLADGVVHVDNRDVLKSFIKSKKKATNELAEAIKKEYREKYDKELDITTRSLAVEISAHYLCQEWALALEKVFGKIKPTRWLVKHTIVIDCGEKAKDGNRIIWDILSKIFR